MSTTAPPRSRRRLLTLGRKSPAPKYPERIRPDGSRDVELPLREHLRELRDRLIKAILVLPSALKFLLSFGSDNVHPTPTISQFLDFVTHFLLAVGIAFETPVIIFVLAKLGVATPKRLSRFRRWAILLAFIIAAIITPT